MWSAKYLANSLDLPVRMFTTPPDTSLEFNTSAKVTAHKGFVSLANTIQVLPPAMTGAITEVLNSSDVSGGVVNILTGNPNELAKYFADHMDVNAMIYCEKDNETIKMIQDKSALNVKRILLWNKINWNTDEAENPYLILDAQEIKTTWHPIENIGGAKAGY